ncbi:MAG: methionyl-tRNA formyltransferase [Desulfobacteraceae bacterium]|nr:MAG: methionyl-tRNA formyltransferase [Desulfobacteraceae bacterium]
MGTPEFAVPSLIALHEGGMEVSLVITQPDRPSGRGLQKVAPPVKTAAEPFRYPVIQPDSIRKDAVMRLIRRLEPDFFVVVAFGKILPKDLLSIPRICPVNVHASLLPKYRGAAPVAWAILNMEKETGVTTMHMDEGMDTGDILLSESVPIFPDDTTATLSDRLAHLGAGLLIRTLNRLVEGRVVPKPQDHSLATSAPMLRKKDGRIDWSLSAERLEAFIRGVTPWPGAFTFLNDRRLKIFSAEVVQTKSQVLPGTVVQGFPDELRVSTGGGLLSILEVQAESGKRMHIREFLHGFSIPVGARFE